MKSLYLLPLLFLAACSKPAVQSCEGLEIRDAWIREMPPGPKVTAGYLQLNNRSEQDIIVSRFSSPAFARVELHENLQVDGQMQMRKMNQLTIPATEGLDLQPGGWHLMLFEPVSEFEAGASLELKLHCGEDVATTTSEVRKNLPSHHEHHGHH